MTIRARVAMSVWLVLGSAMAAAAQDLPTYSPNEQAQMQGGRGVQQPMPGDDQQGPKGPPEGNIAPGDIQAMFEAMTVMEAERFVMLTPEQFPVFVQRLKRLQEARGVMIRRHNRALNELRGMANPQSGRADDATIDMKLRELSAIELEGRAAIDKALEAVDQMLSPKQRARFRMLEDNIEKKKIDFLTKVRQPGGRGGH